MDITENPILIELLQGYESTKKLQAHLQQSFHDERCKSLTESIMGSLEKTVSLMKFLQWSVDGSPKRDKEHCKQNTRKRKAAPKWSEQIKVGVNEGPPLDGSYWRKYGQKNILDAKYPRSYFRCTYHHSEGCMAKKLVQRSDKDPTIFCIRYRGEHTCSASQSIKSDGYSPIATSLDPSSLESSLLENCVPPLPNSNYHSWSSTLPLSLSPIVAGPHFERERMDFDSFRLCDM